VLDAGRHYLTALIAPDRPTRITPAAVATNQQDRADPTVNARIAATVERERFLLRRLTLHRDPEDKFISAFLKPPLYSTASTRGSARSNCRLPAAPRSVGVALARCRLAAGFRSFRRLAVDNLRPR